MSKVYYNQMDSRWRNHPYPGNSSAYANKTCGTSGCGPTCAAMIVSSCREIVKPNQMCDISKQNGHRPDGGTADSLYPYVAQRWGIEYKRLKSSFEAHQACKEGWFVVICCGAGLWTTGGHYILAVGATDTDIEIYDPYLYNGKFNSSSRRGKVRLDGNSAWVNINAFKASSNARTFFAFKVAQDVVITEPVQHSDPKVKFVNTSSANLNVRNNPNGSVVGSLPKGTQVMVYAEDSGWSKIGEGKWVASSYLSDSNPVQVQQPVVKTMYVNTSSANLNVRETANGKVTGSLKKGTEVVVADESNGWSKITAPVHGWVSSKYLSSNGAASKPASIPNTVGQIKKFKGATTIYSRSNLTGTRYQYKANTSIKILQNVSGSVDKVYVNLTGRVGYVNKNSY